MHIITRKRIRDFSALHPDAGQPLARWYYLTKQNNFASFASLRAVFPNADQVGRLTVFNIGGNNYRLIAAIHYNRRKVYIRAILTHREYDNSKWRE